MWIFYFCTKHAHFTHSRSLSVVYSSFRSFNNCDFVLLYILYDRMKEAKREKKTTTIMISFYIMKMVFISLHFLSSNQHYSSVGIIILLLWYQVVHTLYYFNFRVSEHRTQNTFDASEFWNERSQAQYQKKKKNTTTKSSSHFDRKRIKTVTSWSPLNVGRSLAHMFIVYIPFISTNYVCICALCGIVEMFKWSHLTENIPIFFVIRIEETKKICSKFYCSEHRRNYKLMHIR